MSRIPDTGYNLYLGARLLGVLNGGPVVDVDILVHGHQHLLQLYRQVSQFGLGEGWLQNYLSLSSLKQRILSQNDYKNCLSKFVPTFGNLVILSI